MYLLEVCGRRFVLMDLPAFIICDVGSVQTPGWCAITDGCWYCTDKLCVNHHPPAGNQRHTAPACGSFLSACLGSGLSAARAYGFMLLVPIYVAYHALHVIVHTRLRKRPSAQFPARRRPHALPACSQHALPVYSQSDTSMLPACFRHAPGMHTSNDS